MRSYSYGVRNFLRGPMIVVVALVILSISTRLLPLAISTYPYNNDSITECRIAEDIISCGHLEYPAEAFYLDTHSLIVPAHNIMIAYAASAFGMPTFDIAQLIVAILSVITVIGVYLVAREFVNPKSAMVAGLVVSLFGTFVFLSASAWKESLGVALLVLLVYAFMLRTDRRMLALEILILSVLPIVHHLVTVMAFMLIVFLTVWSVWHSASKKRFSRRNCVDVAIAGVLSATAYWYYHANSLDRLSYLTRFDGLLLMILAFSVVLIAEILVLRRQSHSRMTFAPIPAILLVAFVLFESRSPLFPYVPWVSVYVVALALASSVIVFFAWYGIERSVRSNWRSRAIPLCLLLPVLTLIIFAFMYGSRLASHQIVYRTFDFADLSLALGIGIAISTLKTRPKLEFTAVVAVIAALLISFPFAYATNELTGVRHDTQAYEVDALDWIDSSTSPSMILQSDERLSYLARALYDYEKLQFLPLKLYDQSDLSTNVVYVMEEEWMSTGVNDYPNGYLTLDQDYVSGVLYSSDVVYCGGPCENSIIVFFRSPVAENHV